MICGLGIVHSDFHSFGHLLNFCYCMPTTARTQRTNEITSNGPTNKKSKSLHGTLPFYFCFLDLMFRFLPTSALRIPKAGRRDFQSKYLCLSEFELWPKLSLKIDQVFVLFPRRLLRISIILRRANVCCARG